MSGPTRPPSGSAPRQPWTPEQAPKGVTCPACGLANEAGARVCRNCGLPIASATDPLRGVAPGRVDMPSTKRSGLSATIGLLLVVGLLLVGGSLAVSGGGILGSGGRLGAGGDASPTPAPQSSGAPDGGQVVIDGTEGGPQDPEATITATGTSFGYTCDDGAIKDVTRLKWRLGEVQAGTRVGEDGAFDEIYWTLSRQSKTRSKKGTTVTMEWSTPKDVQEQYGVPRVQGDRAVLITFDGPVSVTANQTIEAGQLEAEGIDQIKKIQLFEGADGKVRTAIGLRTESCARMEAKGWGSKKDKPANSRIVLDIENFGTGG